MRVSSLALGSIGITRVEWPYRVGLRVRWLRFCTNLLRFTFSSLYSRKNFVEETFCLSVDSVSRSK